MHGFTNIIPSLNITQDIKLHVNITQKSHETQKKVSIAHKLKRMDPPGFEPGASALQGRRSPRLSYGPI